MDAALLRVEGIAEDLRNCLDGETADKLNNERRVLMEELSLIKTGDAIQIVNGLKFVRMYLEQVASGHTDEIYEDERITGALRMTKKLIQQVAVCPLAVPLVPKRSESKKKARAGPPFAHPVGAPKKGHFWSSEGGVWVPNPLTNLPEVKRARVEEME